MEIENILAKNITAAGEKAAYDAACKRILANKVILAWIMKSCLEEYKDYNINEIAEKYIEGNPQIAETTVNPDERTNISSEQIRGEKTEDSTDFNIAMAKTWEREVSAMCNLSKGVEERGIAIGLERGIEQGMESGTLNAIRNLMETLKMTAEQAMEALKVPEEDKARYAGMLKN